MACGGSSATKATVLPVGGAMVDPKRLHAITSKLSLHWPQVQLTGYESSMQGSAVNTITLLSPSSTLRCPYDYSRALEEQESFSITVLSIATSCSHLLSLTK